MSWLQKRLKELNYTHQDLQQKLAQKGIKRVRATITGWANDKPVSLLNNPEHAKILADVLQWTVLDMLIEAGYDVGVSRELIPFIEEYKVASKKRKSMFMQNLNFVLDFLSGLTEEELDDPEPSDSAIENEAHGQE